MGRLRPVASTWVTPRDAAGLCGDVPRAHGVERVLGACWRAAGRDMLIAATDAHKPEWNSSPGVLLAVVQRDADRPPRVLSTFRIGECELTVVGVLIRVAADPTRRDATPPATVATVKAPAEAHSASGASAP